MKNSEVFRDEKKGHPPVMNVIILCAMWQSELDETQSPQGCFQDPTETPISKRQWSVLTLYHHFPLLGTFLLFPIPFKRIRGVRYQDTQQYGGHAEIIHWKPPRNFTRTALQVRQPATHPPSQQLQDESFSKSKRPKWKKVESKKVNSNKRKYMCIYLYIHIMWTVKITRGKTPTLIG